MPTTTVSLSSIVETLNNPNPTPEQITSVLDDIYQLKPTVNATLAGSLESAAGCLRAALKYPDGTSLFVELAHGLLSLYI